VKLCMFSVHHIDTTIKDKNGMFSIGVLVLQEIHQAKDSDTAFMHFLNVLRKMNESCYIG